jgi:hypothetical protein
MRLQVLEAQLKSRVPCSVRFEESDLYGLVADQRTVATDAVVAGKDLPFVLIGDMLVCNGGFDVESIALALQNVE